MAAHLQHAAWALAALYALDRLLKLLAVQRFFRRAQKLGGNEPAPAHAGWPAVTLLQPLTCGASDLPAALARRAVLQYPGPLQHLLICDSADTATIDICAAWLAAHGDLTGQLITVTSTHGDIADKVTKLRAALPAATGDVLAFVDDDILLRPDAIARFAGALQDRRAGAVFGLAVYTNWSNLPSSLLSAFVNANALLSYLPLTGLTEPFTITGHFYALRRTVFATIGGLEGMGGRFDDDHELARRVMRHGFANVQTDVVYDVDNYLGTLDDYANQMRRWFVIPRQTMAPFLTPYQQFVSLLGSAGNLIPALLALLAVMGGALGGTTRAGTTCAGTTCAGTARLPTPARPVPRAAARAAAPAVPLLGSLALFAAVYALCEHAYLGRKTPLDRWPWVLLSALIAPLQALYALLGSPFGGPDGGDTFTWRGRRIRLYRGGQFEILPGRAPAGRESSHRQEATQ
jgi:ceramide glucosyltransferase